MGSLCLSPLFSGPSPTRHFLSSCTKIPESCCSSSLNPGGSLNLKPIIVSGDPPTFVTAPDRRIIAVGDLHGDLYKARWALNMAGVLSSDGRDLWTGGETVMVQVGDILDRGEDEIAILSLLRSLDMQARAQGGAVFQVNGNHEIINVEGDFRYVESGGFDECTDFLEYLNECEHNWEEAFINWINISPQRKDDRRKSQNYWGPWNLVKRQRGVISRSILLQPGGPLARELARHPVVLKVNDWVFCHGGLLPHHGISMRMLLFGGILKYAINLTLSKSNLTFDAFSVSYGLERMNREVSAWMNGGHDRDTIPSMPFIATKGYDSVVWSRLYSRDTSDLVDHQINQILRILEETLQAVGAKAMVVGHTPQMAGVNCEYGCSIWRIDVGMSRGVLDSIPEVLEIKDDKARAIRSDGDESSELQVLSYI
ncbi:LOW QUALITY PROTEIN: hypothetical protein Cgig2_023987 [Carnegiea gigantea]|uniref:Calcineurin-like phosphoesterase domain-containing protein n=1 Tax=Carnegiea gigantea TaxID=171969 RepID=A0A9Q1KC99_9CARY|nr:LOW QUALITY PROTEIN: hypothetical protein Cgig2_023987 [Carnegiea gigantea]